MTKKPRLFQVDLKQGNIAFGDRADLHGNLLDPPAALRTQPV
jgi:hypothetical protein